MAGLWITARVIVRQPRRHGLASERVGDDLPDRDGYPIWLAIRMFGYGNKHSQGVEMQDAQDLETGRQGSWYDRHVQNLNNSLGPGNGSSVRESPKMD